MIFVRAGSVIWRACVTAEAARQLDLAPGRAVWLATKAQAFRPLR